MAGLVVEGTVKGDKVALRQELVQAGMALAGLSPDERLVEIVELPGHPWFVGVQFHPELKSRPNRAHPLFQAFIAAAKGQKAKGI